MEHWSWIFAKVHTHFMNHSSPICVNCSRTFVAKVHVVYGRLSRRNVSDKINEDNFTRRPIIDPVYQCLQSLFSLSIKHISRESLRSWHSFWVLGKSHPNNIHRYDHMLCTNPRIDNVINIVSFSAFMFFKLHNHGDGEFYHLTNLWQVQDVRIIPSGDC